jgi:hypothetical protein
MRPEKSLKYKPLKDGWLIDMSVVGLQASGGRGGRLQQTEEGGGGVSA